MAYSNFKPTIWSKFIQTELEKKCRLVEDCWTQFEGEAKQGGRVKILGVSAPDIFNYVPGEGIPAPTTIEGTSVQLDIDQAKALNFMIDDLDKAQSVEGLMETLIKEASAKMAQARDAYVAAVAASSSNVSNSIQVSTPAEAKKAVDDALLFLREHDVDIDDEVTITVAPFFYQLLRDALTELKTDNDELIKKGVVGMYDNCKVKISNNLFRDMEDSYMLVRTKRAIAFAGAIDETEAYRPENHFADAVKGLNVYGAKIIRPNELYVIKAHKPAEF